MLEDVMAKSPPDSSRSVLLKMRNMLYPDVNLDYHTVGAYDHELKKWRYIHHDGIGAVLFINKNVTVIDWKDIDD